MADIRAYQPAFTAGVLSPALHARVDLAKYQTGLKKGNNVFIQAHGGVSNRPGLQFINEVKDSARRARLIPFEFNTEQSYILEFGHNTMRVYRNGGLVLSGGVPYEIVTPWPETFVGRIVFAQEADVMYLVTTATAPRKLSRLADDNWLLEVITFAPKIAAPAAPTVTKPGDTSGGTGYTPTVYRYRVAAVSEDTGEESLPSPSGSVTNDLSIAGGRNRVAWAAVAGASRYIIYKEDNGVYGYIGGTSGLQFDDENINPDLADTPQTARNPFGTPGNWPRCVSFVEQRLVFASTGNDPQAVWMSQSANYENFGYSQPSKASDAVTFRIKARQVNEIRAILSVKAMMLLTSAAEWLVSGGSQSDAISPSAIRIDNQGYRGSSSVQPITVGNVVLFAQARGGVIRDFSYEFANDSYTGKDLTILARHMFENKNIKAWDYAQAQNSIVWVVMDDGSLVSLTYMREHEVWAWTTHDSAGGVFEDVAVIAEGNDDVPYFLVRRQIGGVWKRYIERLHSRVLSNVSDAFFVDSGLTYRGAPVSVVSGLGHLEGKEVVALSDGNVVRGKIVTGGSVTLPNPASVIHVGLPYEALIETLALDLGQVQGLGTVQGRMKSVAEVTLRVENTRGIFVGPYDDTRDGRHLVEYRQRAAEDWNEAIRMRTGDIRITPPWDWNTSGSVVIKQFDPLPMTILAVMPDVVVGK